MPYPVYPPEGPAGDPIAMDNLRREAAQRGISPDRLIFAPRLPVATGGTPSDGQPLETDGYILSVIYRQSDHRSALYILDARDLSTVCVALLPHHVPPGFHGNFVEAADCPPGWQA